MFSKIQRLGMGVVTNNETLLINHLLSLGAQMALSRFQLSYSQMQITTQKGLSVCHWEKLVTKNS